MAVIRVTELGGNDYEVSVAGKGPATTHRVHVDPDYAVRLTGGAVDTSRLVECSFTFLLEREPKESILRSFNLSVIQRYFPDYESTIGDMF